MNATRIIAIFAIILALIFIPLFAGIIITKFRLASQAKQRRAEQNRVREKRHLERAKKVEKSVSLKID